MKIKIFCIIALLLSLFIMSGCGKREVKVGVATFQIHEKDCIEKENGLGEDCYEERGDIYSGRYANVGYPCTSTEFSYRQVPSMELHRLYDENKKRLERIENDYENRYWFLMDNPRIAGGWLLVTEYKHPFFNDGKRDAFYRRDFDFFVNTEKDGAYICKLILERTSKRRLDRASNLFLKTFLLSGFYPIKPKDVKYMSPIKPF